MTICHSYASVSTQSRFAVFALFASPTRQVQGIRLMQNVQASSFNVLLVYPRFPDNSFWNYKATCEAVGARYPAAPLGLITVAALLPSDWTLRLVNRNTEQLTDADIAWADLVLTGGMPPQQVDALRRNDLLEG